MKNVLNFVEGFAIGTVLFAALAFSGWFLFSGCKEACPVIDLAAKSCPVVVEYLDDAGVRQRMSISREDAMEMNRAKAAKKDGGR